MLHSGAEEGRLHKTIRVREDSETLGIDRSVGLVEVPLRDPRRTEGVSQSVRDSRLETRAQNLEIVEDVLVVLERCPDQVHLGVVRVSLVFVFGRVALLALLRALEPEGRDDCRLGLLERGGVGHLESNCRLICLPRTDYIVFNL